MPTTRERAISHLKRSRRRLFQFLPLFVVLIASTVCGVSALAGNSTVEPFVGSYYGFGESFTATGGGFSVVSSSSPASGQPCHWSNSTCQTALAAGDWSYSVTLTIGAAAAPSHTYTLTAEMSAAAGGNQTRLGSLTFTTPTAIVAGQTLRFDFDTSSQQVSAPVAVTLSVV